MKEEKQFSWQFSQGQWAYPKDNVWAVSLYYQILIIAKMSKTEITAKIQKHKKIQVFIRSPSTMLWWRLIVFAESARRHRSILFLLSIENPCSDFFQILAVCILALGNLLGNFFLCFSVSSTKSKMATKILCHSLELELLYGFVSCLVWRKDLFFIKSMHLHYFNIYQFTSINSRSAV